jgi:hypothetical protein
LDREEYLVEVEAKRDALALRLQIIMASDLPSRVKNMRIKQVTREAKALKEEVQKEIDRANG